MKKSKISNKKADFMALAGGVAGGFIGNQVTTLIEDQLAKSGNANASTISPLATALIGGLVTMFAPAQFKSVGIGMTAVAGTEALEGVISSASAPTTTATNSATERVYANQPIQGLSGIQMEDLVY